MTTVTMTPRTSTPAVTTTPVATAARFLGHFLAALVGVAFLGRDLEH